MEAPPVTEFAAELSWDKAVVEERSRRRTDQPLLQWLDDKTRWRLHLFERPETSRFLSELAKPGQILDLGCGNGKAGLALDDHFTPFGIEISPTLADAANKAFIKRGGRCVAADTLSGLREFPDAYFSGAMLNSYLEHDPNPLPVLRGLAPKMKAGSPVIIKVPNYGSWNAKVMGRNWCGIRLPDHVNYFTRTSLKAMAGSAGYTVQEPGGVNLPTNDNMWMFLYPITGRSGAEQ